MNVLSVLKDEGYIRNFEDYEERKGISFIKIELKYYNGTPVIKKINRISKPGIRVYSKISDLQKPYGGLGISILSTPKGVGNMFHKLYTEAEQELNDFNPIKLPWDVHPERDQAWFEKETRNMKKTEKQSKTLEHLQEKRKHLKQSYPNCDKYILNVMSSCKNVLLNRDQPPKS